MPRLVMIGAGSIISTRRLFIDLLSHRELQDSTFRMVDIDEGRHAA